MVTSVTENPVAASRRRLDDLMAILRENRDRFSARYGIRDCAVFGSRVRGDERPDSDLDIVVSFHRLPGLVRLVSLENELTELLGLPVDLVVQEALRPDVAQSVDQGKIPL